jgi:DNA-directed RNA polymerase III subunit RPC1
MQVVPLYGTGTTDKKGAMCTTCKGKLIDCAGHFGYIKLEMPVFHIGYFKNIIAILQQVGRGVALSQVG